MRDVLLYCLIFYAGMTTGLVLVVWLKERCDGAMEDLKDFLDAVLPGDDDDE